MDWKDKLNSLYDTNSEFDRKDTYESSDKKSESPKKQLLRVEMEKRNGKPATIISGFEGTDEELKELARLLKTMCSSGGSARGGEILIQGDFRVKVAEFLQKKEYKVKKINFK